MTETAEKPMVMVDPNPDIHILADGPTIIAGAHLVPLKIVALASEIIKRFDHDRVCRLITFVDNEINEDKPLGMAFDLMGSILISPKNVLTKSVDRLVGEKAQYKGTEYDPMSVRMLVWINMIEVMCHELAHLIQPVLSDNGQELEETVRHMEFELAKQVDIEPVAWEWMDEAMGEALASVKETEDNVLGLGHQIEMMEEGLLYLDGEFGDYKRGEGEFQVFESLRAYFRARAKDLGLDEGWDCGTIEPRFVSAMDAGGDEMVEDTAPPVSQPEIGAATLIPTTEWSPPADNTIVAGEGETYDVDPDDVPFDDESVEAAVATVAQPVEPKPNTVAPASAVFTTPPAASPTPEVSTGAAAVEPAGTYDPNTDRLFPSNQPAVAGGSGDAVQAPAKAKNTPLTNHGYDPQTMVAAAQAIYRRLHVFIFTKCGRRTAQNDPTVADAFQKGMDIGPEFANAGNVVQGVEVADILQYYNLDDFIIACETDKFGREAAFEGKIVGYVNTPSGLPTFKLWINANGLPICRTIVPQNINKRYNDGNLKKTALKSRQGVAVSWVLEGDDSVKNAPGGKWAHGILEDDNFRPM